MKAAAVGGIFIAWFNLTKEAFNLSWHIMTTSPKKDTYEPVTSVECIKCRHLFDRDLEDAPFVCMECLGYT